MNQSSAAVSPRRKTTSYRRQNDRPQSTPFQHWKFHDNKPTGGFEASARKLAAGLWQLRFREISWGQELNSGPDDHSQPRFELESSIPCPKFVLERATKWDHCCSKASEQFYPFYLKNCQVTTVSMVSTLNDELMQARLCIRELQAKRKSFKKKVKHLLGKLEEERILRKCRERQKDQGVIEYLMKELGRERRSRQRIKNLNTSLVSRSRFATLDMLDLRKAELILQEVKSLNIQEIGEFSYVPSKSDDIFSTFEELRPYEGLGQCRHVSRSGSECNDNAGQSSPDTEIIEVCSVSEHQPKQKPSYMSKLWRSCPTNGEFYKTPRFRWTFIPTGYSEFTHHSRDERVHCMAPSHVKEVKNGSNAKLLEAKIESQRSQLRHVLKQMFR
ncbi:hypothetical protein M0R45_002538 [Rubus argutus]|uniref:Uncharacterized protein n=1 Tax=Rubus argutus TaxID=59490 RepID=A0AAW1VPM2_RUBAR